MCERDKQTDRKKDKVRGRERKGRERKKKETGIGERVQDRKERKRALHNAQNVRRYVDYTEKNWRI